jgi:SAM-dependent methyltransferase
MSAAGADLRAWTESAPQWIEHADRIAQLTAPASDALVARLAPEPGQRLLDVAAGVGDPALRLARLVGPTGHVTATDGVPGMCAALRQRAAERDLPQLTVRCMPAEQLELPAAAFDGACCRFGAMFFEDPREALTRMRRAVRADGRLVLAVWGAKEANPYFTLAMDALDEIGAPFVPLAPGTRTVFEFAASGALLAVAREAGWRQLREEDVDLMFTFAGTAPEGLLERLASISGRVESRMKLLPAGDHAAARQGVARRARPLVRGADLVMPAHILLVSGVS